jgi:hypothetical protein
VGVTREAQHAVEEPFDCFFFFFGGLQHPIEIVDVELVSSDDGRTSTAEAAVLFVARSQREDLLPETRERCVGCFDPIVGVAMVDWYASRFAVHVENIVSVAVLADGVFGTHCLDLTEPPRVNSRLREGSC